jgi:hypothetical protein
MTLGWQPLCSASGNTDGIEKGDGWRLPFPRGSMTVMERGYVAGAFCGILAGPVLIAASWAATIAQPDQFSWINDPTSDLGADTADARWVSNLGSNLSGILMITFAVALWQILGRRWSARIGTALVGAVGACLFLTGNLTLDCREIDTRCENTTWQASSHLTVAGVTVLALFVSPFVVARAVRFSEGWQDLRVPSLIFGALTVVASIVASGWGEGLGSYVAVITWFAWLTVLAVRMLRLVRASSDPATPAATPPP